MKVLSSVPMNLRRRLELRPPLRLTLAVLAALVFTGGAGQAQDIESEPVRYSSAVPRNPVTQLNARIADGSARLEYEPQHGYLRALLRELNVPTSSQVLVFSKTSLQRDRISPSTPRAIYFNDDVMIGYCQHGPVMEISAVDEVVGTAFYTLDQNRDQATAAQRQTESCLLCHSSSANQGFPGHLVRSLFVDQRGQPLFSSGSYRTDHTSPLAERWGGWYVTGTSGRQSHMGNRVCRASERPEKIPNAEGVNVRTLRDRFNVDAYLTPHSDIVALMVLEHQAGMLNRLARANLETRMALHYERELNRALGRPADERSESARSRIRNVGEAVVQYMLFRDEARLTDPVEGTSAFAQEFSTRGPRDSKGRSLRDLDLRSRLFRYPCSYLIGSRAFDTLPQEVRDYIYQRLWTILNGQGTREDEPLLTESERAEVLEILLETKAGLPDSWNAHVPRRPTP